MPDDNASFETNQPAWLTSQYVVDLFNEKGLTKADYQKWFSEQEQQFEQQQFEQADPSLIKIAPGNFTFDDTNSNNNLVSYVYSPVPVKTTTFKSCSGACPLCNAGFSPATQPVKKPDTSDKALRAAIPALEERVTCPCGECETPGRIWGTIIHLNDKARWTREQIADWLETLDQDLQFTLPEIPENTEGESR